MLFARVPELVLPALSTPVRVLSDSSTVIGRPATRSEATASSGRKTVSALTGGIWLLFSTTVPMCSVAARLVSRDRLAVPPGGQATSCSNGPGSTLPATASPVRYAVARFRVRPCRTSAAMSTLAYGVSTVGWPGVTFLSLASQFAAAVLAGWGAAPVQVAWPPTW